MSDIPKQDLEYVFEVLGDDLKDQKDLLKYEKDEDGKREIEVRIEQLKRGIKIIKEYLKEA